jgi:hypothetical protein
MHSGHLDGLECLHKFLKIVFIKDDREYTCTTQAKLTFCYVTWHGIIVHTPGPKFFAERCKKANCKTVEYTSLNDFC